MNTPLVIFCIGTTLSAYGFLSIFDPERAFRIANLFQVREVELTQYGEDSAVVGGVLCIVVGWLAVGGLASIEYAMAAVALAFAPFAYVYRERFWPANRDG